MRIKTAEIPLYKRTLLERQLYKCALCRIDLKTLPLKDVCLDHDHTNGNIRGVLCRNCNGCEGKVFNLARRCQRDATPLYWLERLCAYLKIHKENPSGIYHSTHKTEDEKRIKRNAKARAARAKSKTLTSGTD